PPRDATRLCRAIRGTGSHYGPCAAGEFRARPAAVDGTIRRRLGTAAPGLRSNLQSTHRSRSNLLCVHAQRDDCRQRSDRVPQYVSPAVHRLPPRRTLCLARDVDVAGPARTRTAGGPRVDRTTRRLLHTAAVQQRRQGARAFLSGRAATHSGGPRAATDHAGRRATRRVPERRGRARHRTPARIWPWWVYVRARRFAAADTRGRARCG